MVRLDDRCVLEHLSVLNEQQLINVQGQSACFGQLHQAGDFGIGTLKVEGTEMQGLFVNTPAIRLEYLAE